MVELSGGDKKESPCTEKVMQVISWIPPTYSRVLFWRIWRDWKIFWI